MLTDVVVGNCLCAALAGETARAGLAPHAGKVLQVRAGPAVTNLRVGPDGRPAVVHRAITPDAQVRVPVQRLWGATDTPLTSAGDSDLLAAFAAVLDSEDTGPAAAAERHCGPLAGALVTNVGEALRTHLPDVGSRLRDTSVAWLTKEARILPDAGEGRRMAADIDRFAAAVESLRRRALGAGDHVRP